MIFEKFGLSKELSEAIKRLGFNKPTLIQKKSIPYIIKGRDVIGESATGSGKTLAFGCGIIERVVAKKGLQALILTPTRELAEQVKNSIKTFAHNKHLNIITVYGGVAINPQISELCRAEVVIATPGRLLDHLQRRTVDLSKVNLLVLDEADRMLDMGFIDDVEKIIRKCPKERQTLFFSATISKKITTLARKHMINPIEVFASKQVDPSKLKQIYYDVPKSMKLSLLIHLLKEESSGLVLVFCNTRISTDFVVKNLKANRLNAIAIHGGLSQNKRTKTIELFNKAKVTVLVCTDVASRGLHIDNVSHVYNFDIPKEAKDYVHRIGRTARAGESGKVINLLCDLDYGNFARIQSEYRDFSIQKTEKPYIKRIMTLRTESPRMGRRPQHGRNPRHGRKNFRRRY